MGYKKMAVGPKIIQGLKKIGQPLLDFAMIMQNKMDEK